MKYGFRRPSLRGRFAARTSIKRGVAHSLGIKMPRGLGAVRNPRKALYNRIYYRTTINPSRLLTGRPHRRRSTGSSAGVGFWLIVLIVIAFLLS